MSATATAEAPVGALVGEWELDSAHSTVGFVTKYLMFSKVRGSFTSFSGGATITDDPAGSKGHGTVEAASIDTGNDQRDGHLRGADFFDVETYPTIEFETTGIAHEGGSHYHVTGDLTMHGATRPIELRAEFLGTARDPYGRDKLAFNATGSIDREEWGLSWNQALETGGVLVSKSIDIEIEGQLLRKQA
ncbi:MAG: YceI family protein [Candidatus Dormibacteria bacterium]